MILMLDGYIDVYLPDFKFMSPEIASRYCNTPDYASYAKQSIAEMVRQCGGAKTNFNQYGIMQKGVIVRHLQLPGHIADSKSVITYLYNTYGDDIYMSIMNQYTPLESVLKYPEINRKVIYISIMNQYTPMEGIEEDFPELGHKIAPEEYDELVDYAIDIGVENGFIQEGDTADESFIPAFDNEGV